MPNFDAPTRRPRCTRLARIGTTAALFLLLAGASAGGAGPEFPAAPDPVTSTTTGLAGLLDAAMPAVVSDAPAPPVAPPPPPPADPAYWAAPIAEAAQAAGLAPELVNAVVEAESAYHADAVSQAGAIGLMQLMPVTAAELGVDPHDPLQNLAGGSRYLASMLRWFGRVDLALAAYNAGPGRVARTGGIPPIAETQHYVSKILARLGLPPTP